MLCLWWILWYNISMRIVGGKYRGKILKEFDLSSTKPSMDKVREAIFDMLQTNILDAVVLDLFAGTGALGIEALSRGAKQVDFVDNNLQAINLIKSNLHGVEGYSKIYQCDYLNFLQSSKTKYDIILLDPPYATDFGIKALKCILDGNILQDDGVVIFETNIDSPPIFNKLFYVDVEPNRKDIYTIPYGGKNYLIKIKHYGLAKVYKIELKN